MAISNILHFPQKSEIGTRRVNGRNAENLEKTAKNCYEAGLRETEVK